MSSIVSLTDTRGCTEVHPCGSALGLEALVSGQYYEFRLSPGRDQADYLLAVARPDAQSLLNALLERQVPWAPLIRLVRNWADQRTLLGAEAPFIWLEFDDLARNVPLVSAPSVCVCVVPNYTPDRALEPDTQEKALIMADQVLEALSVTISPAEARAMREVFARMPHGGRVIHVSVMLGRTPAALKLYGSVPRSALLDYLRDIGFQGDLLEIRRALEELYDPRLVGHESFIDLNLRNFRDPASASLGLAAAQQHVLRGPDPDAGRARLLDRWAAAGLVAPEKLPGLQNWVLETDHFLDLKLVWQSASGWEAKAYLGQRSIDRRMALVADYLARLEHQGRNGLARDRDARHRLGQLRP